MQIEFKERFPIASQEEKEKIKTCLDSIICLSQQSSAAKSCSQLEQQCVINISPQFPETETTEIYFQTDIESQTSDLQQIVEIGDVAFWPPGQAICLFFGQTPMSTPNEIRPASEVAVFGKFIDNPKMLKVVKSGESISLIKA